MTADVRHELPKALFELPMVVKRKVSRMRLHVESAQRTRQPRHLSEQLLRMPTFGNIQMPQHGVTAVNCVEKPEVGDIHLPGSGLKASRLPFRAFQRFLFLG